jgi:extracellular elastinolytic metalloproteinase
MIRSRASLPAAIAAAALLAQPALAERPQDARRNYDARIDYNKDFKAQPDARNKKALDTFARNAGVARDTRDLSVAHDEFTGAVRSLSHHRGFLSFEANVGADIAAARGEGADSLAVDFARANADLLGLEAADLDDYEVTDRVFSEVSGATRVYLRQRHAGLGVYNGQLQVNVNREGRVLGVNNLFMPGAARSANDTTPRVTLAAALAKALEHAGIAAGPVRPGRKPAEGPEQRTELDHQGVSKEPLVGKLMWLPVRAGQMRLVWNFQVATLDGQHWYDFTVDAVNGKVWTRIDWMSADTYKVYALPAESPQHTSPLPPADGRVTLTNPANANASPFGWHDTNGAAGAEFTTTQGNNVHAYTDTDANNSPDSGSSPSGGASLAFDFPLDLAQAPSAYRPAAVTNLFYLNNAIHDIQYQYGFDEAGGNFQTNNYGKGGLGNDSVMAEAQDGSGTNNANFGTPPDGQRPRMQMYVWTAPTPDKDGDVDASIVIHEYGHGISNRLVGGPNNTSCLGNNQQPGEGLSDWWALVYTAKAGDTGPQRRGIGTYSLNQPVTGNGIRTAPYSTDNSINTWTYQSINGMAIPHGVGSVWAQAAWEMYWALVDHWGWDANLYNATGSAGNQRAMLYVNEGLKNTACSPTFTQVRDGIIQAATDLHGGEDVCRIWQAFAAFGLGTNAVSGGSNSTSPTNGFNVPSACGGANVPPVANAGADQAVATGSLVTLNGSASNDPDGGPNPLAYSWTQTSGPAVTLSGASSAQATFTASVAGTYVFQLQVTDGSASATDSVSVSAGTGIAAYDSAIGAPKCGSVGNLCDSGTLLNGRATLGPEPNQPNTADSCTDGASGSYHSDESNDKIRVVSVDGTDFAAGKQVRIEATVWAYSTFSSDKLDLYYSATATSPSWTFVATLSPTVAGAQTLSATYTLPSGSMQAVRARFRYNGSASPCTAGSYDDHDDLVFAVGSGGGDTTAPTTSITSPAGGATVSGTVAINANASDNVAVTRVDFYAGATLLGSDTTSPYSYSWNTTTVANGSYALTTRAVDAAGNTGTSAAVSVTVNNTLPDTTAPTTSITSPAGGATVSGTVAINANAADNVGVTRVDFYAGATLLGSDTTSPYSYSWNTTTVANGSYSLTTRAVDAAGNTGTSAAVSVTVSNTTPELITNGGFEGSSSPWVRATNWTWSNTGTAQAGTGYVQSANLNNISSSNTLYQQFAIPASASGTGTFYTYITTQETTTSTVYDRLYVEVRNTSGTLLATLATYSNLNKSTGYVQRSVNLSAYKGQTVRLQFRVTSDVSLPTIFRVDSVSVQ